MQGQNAAMFVAGRRKSVVGAATLALFFGPLGMFYATVPGAFVMLVISGFFGTLVFGIGIVLAWPICIMWAALAARSHNKRLLRSLLNVGATANSPPVDATVLRSPWAPADDESPPPLTRPPFVIPSATSEYRGNPERWRIVVVIVAWLIGYMAVAVSWQPTIYQELNAGPQNEPIATNIGEPQPPPRESPATGLPQQVNVRTPASQSPVVAERANAIVPPELVSGTATDLSLCGFRFTMSRREVHVVLERLHVRARPAGIAGEPHWIPLPGDQYPSIDACGFEFADAEEIIHPPDDADAILPAAQLTPDEAAAPLRAFIFELADKQGHWDLLVAACKRRFGEPWKQEKQPNPPSPDKPAARLMWHWPKTDRTVTLTIFDASRSGDRPAFRAVLAYGSDVFSEILAAQTARRLAGRHPPLATRIQDIQLHETVFPELGQPLPNARLAETYYVTGHDGAGSPWAGSLRIARRPASNLIAATINWQEGTSLGSIALEGGLFDVGTRGIATATLLVLQPVMVNNVYGSVSVGVFVAAVAADGSTLAHGLCGELPDFRWRGLKAGDGKSTFAVPTGTWRVNGPDAETFTLLSFDPFSPQQHGFVGVMGACRSNSGFNGDRGAWHTSQFVGSFNLATGRCVLYAARGSLDGQPAGRIDPTKRLDEQGARMMVGYMDRAGKQMRYGHTGVAGQRPRAGQPCQILAQDRK